MWLSRTSRRSATKNLSFVRFNSILGKPTETMDSLQGVMTDFVIPAFLALIVPVIIPITYGYMKGGAMHNPLYVVFGIGKRPNTVVEGFVAPGYESVRTKFTKILQQGMEEKAQVSAFVDGELVVNLSGVHHVPHSDESPKKEYNTEAIQCIFSSTKAISSIVVAMLVDRGHLRYDMRIAELWPEFAQENKQDITVEDLMKHESGLEKFPFVIKASELHRDALKSKSVSDKIAASKSTRGTRPPKPPAKEDKKSSKKKRDEVSADDTDDGNRSYHFVTRDIIINEIVMRADPEGRTLGEIVRDDIAEPLGISDQVTLGKETMQQTHKLFPLVANSKLWVFAQLINVFDRKVAVHSCVLHLFMMYTSVYHSIARLLFGPNFAKPTVVVGKEHGLPDDAYVVDLFNHPQLLEAEIPSANGCASAYALAKIASVMACGGSAHGVNLLSEASYAKAMGNPTKKHDRAVMARTKFTSGGWHIFDSAFGFYRHGAVGWFGLSGTALQWHEKHKVGFGYTCTLLAAELGAKNSSILQNEVLHCAKGFKIER